jgi:hypothetical protein
MLDERHKLVRLGQQQVQALVQTKDVLVGGAKAKEAGRRAAVVVGLQLARECARCSCKCSNFGRQPRRERVAAVAEHAGEGLDDAIGTPDVDILEGKVDGAGLAAGRLCSLAAFERGKVSCNGTLGSRIDASKGDKTREELLRALWSFTQLCVQQRHCSWKASRCCLPDAQLRRRLEHGTPS